MSIDHIMRTKTVALISFCTLLIAAHSFAQAPQLINYQAVARDAGGNTIAGQTIGIKFNIRNAASNGPVVFSETHSVTTNQFGLFNLTIGSGTPVIGTLAAIDWSADLKFLQVRMDINNGNSYVDMGTQQLISVPYSLASAQADALSPTATVQPAQLTDGGATAGQVLVWEGANWVAATAAEGTVYTAGDGIDITGGVISNTGDLDNANEIQTLSVAGSQISLSNGGGSIQIPNSWLSTANNGILNPNIGNVAISPLTNPTPTASLDVYRGNGPDGTAAFRGTTHASHFSYGVDEDTYIRAGKNGSKVYINDAHNGHVNIATGGGGLGIGINADLSYKTQLYSDFGKGLRLDVVGSASGSPEGLNLSVGSAASLTKYGVYATVNGLGAGDNIAVHGNAFGGASGYKVGVQGTANGSGLSNHSIGVQGIASTQSGSNNYGVHGFAEVANSADNFGLFGTANGSTTNNYGVFGQSHSSTASINIGVYGSASGSALDDQLNGADHLQGGFGTALNANYSIYGDAYAGGWAGFFDGNAYAYDLYYVSSDSALKTDVRPVMQGLATVEALRPVSYRKRESAASDAKFSDRTEYGFIAQELAKVLPELVTSLIHPVDVKNEEDDRVLLAVNYDGLIPVLTSAIQQQQDQIEQLTAELETLKNLVQTLVQKDGASDRNK